MKIIKYIGGLGNQMFIYAFSVVLKEKFGEEVLADTHYYNEHNFHNGLELEKIFDIKLQRASIWNIIKLSWYIPSYYLDFHLCRRLPKRKRTYYEHVGGACDKSLLQNDPGDQYYWGFWQDHSYYDDYRDVLRKVFRFKNDLNEKNQQLYDEIEMSDSSVGIHIRRGDYLNNKKYMGICDVDYYSKGITYIKSKIHNPFFYIYSNDMEWCKQNIVPIIGENRLIYVDWNKGDNSYIDMQLMSRCKSLIIANSSFSWWAAYLNDRDPLVISPQKWKNNYCGFDFHLPNWITF